MTLMQTYVNAALKRARFERLEDGLFCATVKGLRGVIATGETQRECRLDLEEAIEAWVLMRVAFGVRVPAIGKVRFPIPRIPKAA